LPKINPITFTMNIIVTGAGRGIGFELVKRFAQDGNHRIVAVSRNSENLEQLKMSCLELNKSSIVFPLPFDLTSYDFENKLLKPVLACFDSIDILINNAGFLINKRFSDLTADDFDQTFAVNVKSVFLATKALLPYFNKPSHIVNVSSMGGVQGSAKFQGLSLYSAAKGAVVVLTEAMAEEFKDRAINVNCLAFGAVQTEMFAAAFPGYKAPLQPDEMAVFVEQFAISGHKFFNGKTLPVSVSTP
jgi:3-oxoacyl-[acyl-carrier protein] reductase